MSAEIDPARTPPAPTPDDRWRAVQAYQAAAAANPDPTVVNLGYVNGDLLRLAHQMALAIHDATHAGALTPKVTAGLDMYLKILRQWDRLESIRQSLREP